MTELYHTSLSWGRIASRRALAGRAIFTCGVAFVYDLFDRTYPTEYDQCDVMYSDLPWISGWSIFEERAGANNKDGIRSYRSFITAVCDHLTRYTIPIVLVTGKHALRFFTVEPQAAIPTTLNNNAALALWFNSPPLVTGSERAILSELARNFQCVGDFCCGFGRTARTFARHRKTFVVSDYNPSCIAHIEDTVVC